MWIDCAQRFQSTVIIQPALTCRAIDVSEHTQSRGSGSGHGSMNNSSSSSSSSRYRDYASRIRPASRGADSTRQHSTRQAATRLATQTPRLQTLFVPAAGAWHRSSSDVPGSQSFSRHDTCMNLQRSINSTAAAAIAFDASSIETISVRQKLIEQGSTQQTRTKTGQHVSISFSQFRHNSVTTYMRKLRSLTERCKGCR